MRRRELDELTDREREVLALLRRDFTNEQIAQRLGISLDGAKYHVSQILSKLGVASREEAAAVALGEPRRWWARWPLWAKVASAATVAAALLGIGIFIWIAVDAGREEEDELAVTSADCQFSPGSVAGKTEQIPTGLDGSAVCWEAVPGAARYSVALTVVYYGNCEVFLGEEQLAREPASLVGEVGRGSNRFEFPRPSDERYTIPKDITLDLRALDEAGSEIARGGFGLQKAIDYPSMCGSSSGQVRANGEEIPFTVCVDNIAWVRPSFEDQRRHILDDPRYSGFNAEEQTIFNSYFYRDIGSSTGAGRWWELSGLWTAASGRQEAWRCAEQPSVQYPELLNVYLLSHSAQEVQVSNDSVVIRVEREPRGYQVIQFSLPDGTNIAEPVIEFVDASGSIAQLIPSGDLVSQDP